MAIFAHPALIILPARCEPPDIGNNDVQRKHLNPGEEHGEPHQSTGAIAPDARLGRDVRDDLVNRFGGQCWDPIISAPAGTACSAAARRRSCGAAACCATELATLCTQARSAEHGLGIHSGRTSSAGRQPASAGTRLKWGARCSCTINNRKVDVLRTGFVLRCGSRSERPVRVRSKRPLLCSGGRCRRS